MNEQDIKKILPEWTLSYTLSEKRGEKLYQAERTLGETVKYSTIRIVNIPADKDEAEKLSARFTNEEDYRRYISDCVRQKKAELQLLRTLSEKPGIVSLRESYDVSNNDETGYILIARYDYIEPLERYIRSNGFTVGNTIRMGVDICRGLEVLRNNKIVHGNIRPENIYINSLGRFRLGGFDIDLIRNVKRLPKKTISALRYISPEMCLGEKRDYRSDIYALGMVLYSMLNGGKLPFEDEYGQDRALKMRLLGEALPRPAYDVGKLTDIVMKACSFNPDDRYETPLLMRQDLESAFAELKKAMLDKEAQSKINKQSRAAMTFSDNRKPFEDGDDFDEKAFDKMAEKKRREQRSGIKSTLIALCSMFVILGLCVAAYFGIGREIGDYNIELPTKYNYVYNGKTKSPKVTIDGLTEGKQYIVSYSDNKKVGTATVTVRGIGRFRGTKSTTFDITPPACKNFAVGEVTENTVKLTWDMNKSADDYRIYIYNQDGEWERLMTLQSYETECVIEDLEPQTTYKFKLIAGCKSDGEVYTSKSVTTSAETLQHIGWW